MRFKKSISVFLILFLLFSLSYQTETLYAKNTKYHIKVNRRTNSATVYERMENGEYVPIKAMLCGTGGPLSPLGTFYTSQKLKWVNFFQPAVGRYATRITGHYLFHSIPYRKKSPDSMLKGQFKRLGTNSSDGCVRLALADAKWIFENCPLGTKVTIYEDKNPGPLGKPKPYPYPEDNGYDPSDIWAKGNPVLEGEPKIIANTPLVVNPEDTEIDLLEGVTALSFQNKPITEKVRIVEDNINYSKPGKYKIVYEVKDKFKSVRLTRTVIVE